MADAGGPVGTADRPGADRLRMDVPALNAFLRSAFPHAPADQLEGVIAAWPGFVRCRLVPDAGHLRPGGIVSGPTQMGLADRAAYVLVLAHIGPVAMAVTSTLTINFLRACEAVPVTADARLLRLGRRLAVADVRIWTTDPDRPAAQASVTYAIP